jgi:peptidoglycan hydrolase-like amidase/Tfp pilus assembly protein PilF
MGFPRCYKSLSARAAAICVTAIATISCAEPINANAEGSGRPGGSAPPERVVSSPVAAAHWYEGNPVAAVTAYRELLAENPDNEDVRLSLVVLLRQQGAIEEALQYSAGFAGELRVEHEMNLALAGIAPEARPDSDDLDSTDATSAFDRHGTTAARYHFWRGVRYVAGGAYSHASHHFTQALETADGGHFPYAHYALGRLAERRGDYGAAREAYRSALRQDGNLTEVFVPLARAHWELDDHRAAWDQLERARIALPWDNSIPRLLAEWEDQRPALTADRETRDAVRRAEATPPRVDASTTEYQDEEVLRVGLVENLDSVYLKTGGPFILSVEGETVYDGPDAVGSVVLHVQSHDDEISVKVESGETLYEGTAAVRVGYRDRTRTTTVFDMTYGHGQFSSGREDRSYRGEIEILPRGGLFTVVNRLSVEEYLYSVVPSEMPAWWPREALQAQAIAARSYTLYPRNRYEDRGFDLLSSVTSAYYPGVTNEHPRTTEAVDATRGLVLRDGSRPLDAVYSANHAGYAEAAGSVWGWPNSLVATSDPLLPDLEPNRSPAVVYRWLVSRPDSYSGRAPYAARSSYRWNLLVPREAIERRLADSGQSVGTVQMISPGPRGISGRVESVTIRGSDGETIVRRDAIRSRLGGLRSNLFVVSAYAGPDLHDSPTDPREADGAEDAPPYFFFQGAGWGHGVGLDQTGAAGMAEAGFDAETILNHYYPRNEVVQWY